MLEKISNSLIHPLMPNSVFLFLTYKESVNFIQGFFWRGAFPIELSFRKFSSLTPF